MPKVCRFSRKHRKNKPAFSSAANKPLEKIGRLAYLCRMIRLAFFGIFSIVFSAAAGAQSADNPFEMKYRLSKLAAAASRPAAANPFDVKPHQPPGAAVALAENVTKPFRPSSFLPKEGDTLSNFGLFATLVAMLVFFTFCMTANRKVVGKAWRGFLNDNGLTVAQREASGFVGITPYFFLYASFLLNAAMFMFLVVRVFRKETFNNWAFLLTCLAVALVIFLSKHLLLAVVKALFPVEKEARRYDFLIIVFNCVLGVFLLPLNFLLALSEDAYSHFWVFWTLGLVTLFYAYRSFRSSQISGKFLADNQFHFLLYLCAIEIAPVLLVIKLVMIQMK
jgi:hypothetical protein